MRNLAVGLAALVLAGAAAARDLHVRPGADGAGTAERPFPSVAAALEAAAPGDRVLLHPGAYGVVEVAGGAYDPPVRVVAAGPEPPRLAGLAVGAARGLSFEGLLVESDGAGGALVTVGEGAEDIRLEGLTIRSGLGHAGWDAATWRARARRGIVAEGTGIAIVGNRLSAVSHAIEVPATDARVAGNVVDGFSGDGIRGLGPGGRYEGNTVQNCVQVDDNHADGFQSWSVGPRGEPGKGVLRDVVLRGNTIRNHTGGRGPLTCHLQGIGMFDGMYAGWLIEDNLVEVDHWHGITVMGARRVRVVGNVVRNLEPGPPGPPWITITAAKGGRPGADNLIAGNQATGFPTGGPFRIDPRVTALVDNLRLAPAR